ncbi:hypothetical protein AB0O10_20160, partial [Streptomyces lydicus]
MVVVLVGLVRSAGVRLASGVTALDVIANWIVNWPQLQENPAWLLRPVGLLPTTLFGLDEFFEPAQENQRVEEANGPGTQKSPAPYGAGLSHNDCSAASYSPTGSPLQY